MMGGGCSPSIKRSKEDIDAIFSKDNSDMSPPKKRLKEDIDIIFPKHDRVSSLMDEDQKNAPELYD